MGAPLINQEGQEGVPSISPREAVALSISRTDKVDAPSINPRTLAVLLISQGGRVGAQLTSPLAKVGVPSISL